MPKSDVIRCGVNVIQVKITGCRYRSNNMFDEMIRFNILGGVDDIAGSKALGYTRR